jgi:ParB family chromosome partitioning protein
VRRAAAELAAARAPGDAAKLITAQTVADAAAIAPVAHAALAGPKAGELLASDATRAVVLPTALGDRKLDELRALAQTTGKAPARLTAIGSLGRLGGEEARKTLQGILDAGTGKKGEPEEVRKLTYRALRRLQRAEARKKAFGAVGDELGGPPG